MLAPSPWQDNVAPTDPDFSQCAVDDALCRMALFERISASSNLFLYGGCNWVFFNNNQNCNTTGGKCQKNAIQVLDSSAIYLYGTNTKSTINMILDGNKAIAMENENAGGWGGVVAAYLYNS
jgi:glucan 1,3-beta-glucosidase